MEERPSPDDLLKVVKHQERLSSKGNLKIFLGMAAGVGKTYAMLEAAQKLRHAGLDVVVGIINTHGREETASLLEGLKIIPEKKLKYKEVEFSEFDLDEVLRIKPSLVLVDELAHSNVPGSRHPKRWQDVNEILDYGIDVYTTLNVQHIESLKEIIEHIAGITIRETVPDSIIESAADIVLVDLTPFELLQRLKEGKVYLGDKSEIAARNFFKEDRLTALREIVLRYAAEKVDHDLHEMESLYEKKSSWRPRERLLVAINDSPYAQKLIRTTRRLASHLDAPWIALHVDEGRFLTENETNMLAKNLSLARDLGAEVITTNDPNIAEAIQRVSHQRGVTQIIIGRPPKKTIFGIFQRTSLVDKLARQSGDIDIYVIKHEASLTKKRKRLVAFSYKKQIYSYSLVFLCVLLLSSINWFLLPFIGYKVIGVIFLIVILFLSLFVKKGPVFFAAILYALVWIFLFTESFKFGLNEDSAFLALYFLTAIATGILVDRTREHQEMLTKREESVQALYDIVRKIATTPSLYDSFKLIKEQLDRLFEGAFEIMVKKIDNGLDFEKPYPLLIDDKERSAAVWVFDHGKEAGWSTETLPLSQNLYLPLKGFHEIVGVLIYKPAKNKPLTPEQKNFLYTVCQQLANYLEREFSEERTKQNEQLRQVERIHRTILDRIYLVFKKPLITTQSAIKMLKNKLEDSESKFAEQEIIEIENSSQELMKTLANISAMAQLSEGLIPLNKSMYSLRELIEDCCENIEKESHGHRISIKIQEGLPLIMFDFYLIQILLFNLLNNAIVYSPRGSLIEIEGSSTNGYAIVSVSDEGKGIPEDQLEVIFEKFYRLPESTSSGVGLGLAIAKTIAEIHHGFLKAENRPLKGARFSLYLPY